MMQLALLGVLVFPAFYHVSREMGSVRFPAQPSAHGVLPWRSFVNLLHRRLSRLPALQYLRVAFPESPNPLLRTDLQGD